MFKGIYYGNFGEDIIKSATPPGDTNKFWFNISDYCIYYYNAKTQKWIKLGEIPISTEKVDCFNDGSGVALFQFNGNANDTGGVYNGTWNGTEQYDTGKFGQAAKFDGSSYVGNDNLNIGDLKVVTFTFWASSTQTTGFKIMGADDNNNDDFALSFTSGTDFHPYFRTNLNNDTTVNDAFINNGSWHFYTITFDSNGFKIWRDAILLKDNGSQQISATSSKFRIANVTDASGNTAYYTGLIDQVRIFNRALTNEEIKALYNYD